MTLNPSKDKTEEAMSDLPNALRHQSDRRTILPEHSMMQVAARHIEMLEAALRKIHEAIAGYSHPESRLTKDEFIDAVIAAADDRELVKAMKANAD